MLVFLLTFLLRSGEKIKGNGRSTDAMFRGGLTRSSEEVSVMGMERRGLANLLERKVNCNKDEPYAMIS